MNTFSASFVSAVVGCEEVDCCEEEDIGCEGDDCCVGGVGSGEEEAGWCGGGFSTDEANHSAQTSALSGVCAPSISLHIKNEK